MGEQYTICDPYLYTISGWLEGDGVDLAKLPKVADHRKRMADPPAVQKVLVEKARNERCAASGDHCEERQRRSNLNVTRAKLVARFSRYASSLAPDSARPA